MLGIGNTVFIFHAWISAWLYTLYEKYSILFYF